MLVLTRKPGEQIVIDGNVVITVLKIGPGRVKLGIKAPDDVDITRTELILTDGTNDPDEPNQE